MPDSSALPPVLFSALSALLAPDEISVDPPTWWKQNVAPAGAGAGAAGAGAGVAGEGVGGAGSVPLRRFTPAELAEFGYTLRPGEEAYCCPTETGLTESMRILLQTARGINSNISEEDLRAGIIKAMSTQLATFPLMESPIGADILKSMGEHVDSVVRGDISAKLEMNQAGTSRCHLPLGKGLIGQATELFDKLPHTDELKQPLSVQSRTANLFTYAGTSQWGQVAARLKAAQEKGGVLNPAQLLLLSAAEEMIKGERKGETSVHRDLPLEQSDERFAVVKFLITAGAFDDKMSAEAGSKYGFYIGKTLFATTLIPVGCCMLISDRGLGMIPLLVELAEGKYIVALVSHQAMEPENFLRVLLQCKVVVSRELIEKYISILLEKYGWLLDPAA